MNLEDPVVKHVFELFQCIATRRLPDDATFHTLLDAARKHILKRQKELQTDDLLQCVNAIPEITAGEAELYFMQPGTPEIMVTVNAKFGECQKVLKIILELLNRPLPHQHN